MSESDAAPRRAELLRELAQRSVQPDAGLDRHLGAEIDRDAWPDPVPSLSAAGMREAVKAGGEAAARAVPGRRTDGSREAKAAIEAALPIIGRELAECKEALEKAHTHIGVLASVLPVDLVPKYKERLAALNAEARPATAEPDEPNPERSSPDPTRSADRGVS